MTFFRALWRYLKRVGNAIGDVLAGVGSFFAELLRTLFEGPIEALERLVGKILDLLASLLDLLRTGWLRIWQKAPPTPRDRRTTPGRSALPLLASTATVSLWYLLPLAEQLELSPWRFRGALLVTWVIALVGFRWLLRRDPPNRAVLLLIDSHRRTGLIWFERGAFLALSIGTWVSLGKEQAASAPLLLAIGFLVLMASEYQDRGLTDALPAQVTPLEPLEPGASPSDAQTEPDANAELRTFRWDVPRATRSDAVDITVPVDADRYEQMASLNPKRPTGGHRPDWTPWVVGGTTDEVIRAAREIRRVGESKGFSRFEEAAAVLGFAQSVPYALDIGTTGEEEYWRFPIETMFEQIGDCEDMSILAASVLRELGHDVLPLVTHDHAAIGIAAPVGLPGTFVEHEGRRYYYCETTAAGMRIGELPASVDPDDLRACPLRSREEART